ncbi:MAG TPA: ester cyclase [Terriglobia bacterium]|jgi:steroid delta-isomerase-like uncharacterized protein|nr:ester cyclase [Terriglobia bacterium]
MPDHQKDLIIRWFEEVWNQGRRETIDEMLSPDSVLHDGEVDSRGPQEFKAFFDRMNATFSEMRLHRHEVISEGIYACLRWSVTARHTGDALGLPPTGREIRITGITMIRFDDGKFAEAWQNWDMHGLIQQITGASAVPGVYIGTGSAG